MAGYIDVPKAIETAERILAEKETVGAQVRIVRDDLRHAVALGDVTPEQRTWVEEHFPERAKGDKDEGDKAAAKDEGDKPPAKPKAA